MACRRATCRQRHPFGCADGFCCELPDSDTLVEAAADFEPETEDSTVAHPRTTLGSVHPVPLPAAPPELVVSGTPLFT